MRDDDRRQELRAACCVLRAASWAGSMSTHCMDVDGDDSPMSWEESTTKGQQSFTIEFRRDKLAVIFPRIIVQSGLMAGVKWARADQARDAPASTLRRPSWTLDMLASVSRNKLPRPAWRHYRTIRFSDARGHCIARRPSRPSADVLADAHATPSLHSQCASSVHFA